MVKALSFVGEEIAMFFMASRYAPAVFVLGVMALFGFGGPFIVSLFR